MTTRSFVLGPLLGILVAAGLAVASEVPGQPTGESKQLEEAYRQGKRLLDQGRLAEAIGPYEKVVALADHVFGPDHIKTGRLLNNLAYLYQQTGQYRRAEPLYKRSLTITEAHLGPTDPELARAHIDLGELYRLLGTFNRAEPLYRRALSILETARSKDSLDVALCLNNLSLLYQDMGEYEKAEPLSQRSLDIVETRLGKDHPTTATCLNNLALLSQARGNYEKAELLYRRSLTIREKQFGPDHPLTALSLNNLGQFYQSAGQHDRAEALYQRSLRIREEKLGKDHPAVAASLNNLAGLYRTAGAYDTAEALYQRSLQINTARLGKDHLLTLKSMTSLGGLYQLMGLYDRAEVLYRTSLKGLEDRLGKDHPEVAVGLNNLSLLYGVTGQSDKAELLLRRCLDLRKHRLGKDHPDTAISMHNLAAHYQVMGNYERADELHRPCQEILEARLGREHPTVADCLNNRGLLYFLMGDPGRAEPLYQRSLRISAGRLGKDHPHLASGLNNLAELYASTGRSALAGATFEQARRSRRRFVSQVLPALSEAEQLVFLRRLDEEELHMALSFSLAHAQDQSIQDLAAGWVLNAKGATQQALAESAVLARDGCHPEASRLVPRLLTVRSRLAALTYQRPRPGQEADYQQRLQELREQDRQLAKEIGRLAGRPVRDDPWVSLDEVRRALPKDGVLIEIGRIRVWNFDRGKDSKWQPHHYVAWVIPPRGQGAVREVDLGEAERIEDAVWKVRQGLMTAPRLIARRGEQAAEEAIGQSLGELGRLILQPLTGLIRERKRWFISPDADLWLVPWAALPVAGGHYAVEDHTLTYLVSGRDLVGSAARSSPGQGLVLADPDYDLSPEHAATELKRLVPERPLGGLNPAQRSGGLGGFHWRRLPGTAREARAIVPGLRKYTGTSPSVYVDRQALEGVFKAAQRPGVVVLSTHGFFFPDQEEAPVPSSGRGLSWLEPGELALPVKRRPQREGRSLENPLVRCGLVLAGANHWTEVLDRPGEDGILTGLEISGADLRGTDLVVLSACETGLGQVHTGQGVACLRQAFQLAGARGVLSTLWQIPDGEPPSP
jgi:tetratricopeptide (TPR) repeat protein/CHAT domain-containing protein